MISLMLQKDHCGSYIKNRMQRGKGQNTKISQDNTAVVQSREDGSLDNGSSSEGVKK